MDQSSGEDMNIAQTKRLRTGGDMGTVGEVRNPDRPSISSLVPLAPDLEHVSMEELHIIMVQFLRIIDIFHNYNLI